jgi:hypothetical protein
MGKSNGIVDNIKSIASTTPTSKSKRQAKKFAKQAVKAFAGEQPKTTLVQKVKNAYNRATGRSTVYGEMDGKRFTGTEKTNKRKSVLKVSNPNEGSSKMVDRFDRSGKLKSQKFVDRDANGKKVQVIKKKY